MLNKQELIDAINYCEDNIHDLSDCQKLASLYVIYNQKYRRISEVEPICEVIVQEHGDNEFFSAIRGKNASDMWQIMNELMTTLAEVDPGLYERTLSKL